MLMKKRIILIISIVLAVAMISVLPLTGCKTEAPAETTVAETTAAATTVAETTAEETTAATEPVPQIVIEVTYGFSETEPTHVAFLEAKKAIEEKTDGRITFKLYPSNTYGTAVNCIQAVRMGVLACASAGFTAEFYKPAGAIYGPYLFRDYDHFYKFLESDYCQSLEDQVENAAGYVILGNGHFGFRETILTKACETVDDFSKIKLRVSTAPPFEQAAVALGATGTPIPITDVYMSIQTGVVDGSENPTSQIVGMKFYEVAKFLHLTDHMIASQYWAFSRKWWNDLSPEDQALVSETITAAQREVERLVMENIEADIQLMKDNGVTVLTPDKQQFMDRLPLTLEVYPEFAPVYEEVKKIQ